jgi:hypothetical protein
VSPKFTDSSRPHVSNSSSTSRKLREKVAGNLDCNMLLHRVHLANKGTTAILTSYIFLWNFPKQKIHVWPICVSRTTVLPIKQSILSWTAEPFSQHTDYNAIIQILPFHTPIYKIHHVRNILHDHNDFSPNHTPPPPHQNLSTQVGCVSGLLNKNKIYRFKVFTVSLELKWSSLNATTFWVSENESNY